MNQLEERVSMINVMLFDANHFNPVTLCEMEEYNLHLLVRSLQELKRMYLGVLQETYNEGVNRDEESMYR